jgi:N-acetylmuramoyl-L-alanine amidase
VDDHHAEHILGENRELVDETKGSYKFDDLAILANAKIPGVLLECGIIVNRREELTLSSSEVQNRIVTAVTRAVIAFQNQRTRP